MNSNIVEQSHAWALSCKRKKIAIDATCGNGHDSLFLSKLFETVYSFDIQELAIKRAKERLKDCDNVTLIHDTFEHITNYITSFDFVLFNLGFLPGSNRKVKTSDSNSPQAILNAYQKLRPEGLVVICCYTMHEDGLEEFLAILSILETNKINYKIRDTFENQEKLIILYNTITL